jgi:hypothetical protein
VALPDPSTTPPERSTLRASDADRTRTIEALRQHTAEGRLSVDEFDQRVGEAYEARTLGELERCARDLPVASGHRPEPVRTHSHRRPRKNPHVVGFVTTSLLLVFIWLMSGGGYPWPLWAIVPLGLGTAKRVYAEDR